MPYGMVTSPVHLKFGPDEEERRLKYVYDNLESLIMGFRELHENKITKWRKLVDGKPEEEKKKFPWKGASNIVVQVVAMNVETLKAQVMASIWELMPLWIFGLVGDFDEDATAEEQRRAIEEFMSLMGYEPEELDLYRVESVLVDSAIKYGFNVCKIPWVSEEDSYCIGDNDGLQFDTYTKINGPKPEAVPFENFMYTQTAPTLEDSRMNVHKISLSRYQLEERKFLGQYDKDKVDSILDFPDRGGPTQTEREKLDLQSIKVSRTSGVEEEWDFYECHYPYWIRVGGQNRRISIIETYHYNSKTSLRAVYNWYPENESIFIGARLGYTDRGLQSLGYAEMLEHAQIEITNNRNRFADNLTLSNTSLYRIDPDAATRLDANFSMFPTATLPFKEGEFEVFNIGRASDNGIANEQQALETVKARTGLDNGFTAAGGGIINPKRGIYSSMGTFSALQAGNKRSNLHIADFKRTHIDIGRKSLKFYSNFGIGDKLRYFGNEAKFLKMAMESIKAGRMRIPTRSTSGSVNLEMEKQNDMMMINIMKQHYVGIIQILQGLPQAPPFMQDYIINVVIASDFLMRHVLRNFGHQDISRLLPEPQIIKQLKERQANAQRQQRSGRGNGTGGPIPGQLNPGTGENIQQQPVQQGNLFPQGAGTGDISQSVQSTNLPVY